MANPQPDQFTRISNEILGELIRAKLSGQELQLILFIIRKTYGYNKKEDYIALSQMAKALNTSYIRCSQLINQLQQRHIVTLKENIKGGMNKYSFNKDYEQWKTLNKKINPLKEKRKRPLRKTLSTKDNITKEIYIVLSHWNSKESLPTHELKGQIGKRIEYEARKHLKKGEGIEDINKAIDNYAKIYSGKEYYFKYRWDLDEFLKRRGGYLNFKKDFQILHNNYYSEKLAQEKEQRLQREQEKEATKREQERREREYKELEETKPLPKEEVHKLLQKALQPKKDGKIG